MKQFRKRMLASGLAVTVILGTTTPTIKVFANEQTNFNDISENHWAKNQIEAFITEGIIAGYPDGSFKPNSKLTRAEFVKIINKAFGFTSIGTKSFSDVKEDAWYATDIKIAVEKGYINGFEDGTFRPNEEITREQMAKILGIILGISGDGKTSFVDDSKIASWAKKYVDGLAERGLIIGYTDGTFDPKGNATRAEGIKLSSDSKVYKEKQDEIIGNNQNTQQQQKPNNSGSGTGSGETGCLEYPTYPNYPENEDTKQEEKIELPANATVEDLSKSLNNPSVKTVTVTGNMEITEKLEIPEGKTIILNEGIKLDIVFNSEVKLQEGAILDITRGEIVNNGTIDLNGGELKTTSEVKVAKLTRANETVKVNGGKLVINNGTIKVNNLGEIQAEIQNVNENSKLLIGGLWVVNKNEKDSALTINKGSLDFVLGEENPVLGKVHTMVVKGDVTFNDAWRTVIVKATEGANLELNAPSNWNYAVALLYKKGTTYGYEEAKNGSYVGNKDGSWKDKNASEDTTTDSTAGGNTSGSTGNTTDSTTSGSTSVATINTGKVVSTTNTAILTNATDITAGVKISSGVSLGIEKTTGSIAKTTNGLIIVATPASTETITDLVLSNGDKKAKVNVGNLTSGQAVTVTLTTNSIASILNDGENTIDVTIVTTTETASTPEQTTQTTVVINEAVVTTENTATAGTTTIAPAYVNKLSTSDTANVTTVETAQTTDSTGNTSSVTIKVQLATNETLKYIVVTGQSATPKTIDLTSENITSGQLVEITLTNEQLLQIIELNKENTLSITVIVERQN